MYGMAAGFPAFTRVRLSGLRPQPMGCRAANSEPPGACAGSEARVEERSCNAPLLTVRPVERTNAYLEKQVRTRRQVRRTSGQASASGVPNNGVVVATLCRPTFNQMGPAPQAALHCTRSFP